MTSVLAPLSGPAPLTVQFTFPGSDAVLHQVGVGSTDYFDFGRIVLGPSQILAGVTAVSPALPFVRHFNPLPPRVSNVDFYMDVDYTLDSTYLPGIGFRNFEGQAVNIWSAELLAPRTVRYRSSHAGGFTEADQGSFLVGNYLGALPVSGDFFQVLKFHNRVAFDYVPYSGLSYVDWGDGSPLDGTLYTTLSHTYQDVGEFTVKLTTLTEESTYQVKVSGGTPQVGAFVDAKSLTARPRSSEKLAYRASFS